uniref:Uncharacterized protein n=1 Tax=Timema tahoe TaxID=61484 RepID=A0A7R9FMC4_9NEOP|nr:unnamed protein product [Timema tahoe]
MNPHQTNTLSFGFIRDADKGMEHRKWSVLYPPIVQYWYMIGKRKHSSCTLWEKQEFIKCLYSGESVTRLSYPRSLELGKPQLVIGGKIVLQISSSRLIESLDSRTIK